MTLEDLCMNLQATSVYELNDFSKRKVINEIFGKQQIKPQHYQSTFHFQFVAKICERPQISFDVSDVVIEEINIDICML